jgi:hypothetical protein
MLASNQAQAPEASAAIANAAVANAQATGAVATPAVLSSSAAAAQPLNGTALNGTAMASLAPLPMVSRQRRAADDDRLAAPHPGEGDLSRGAAPSGGGLLASAAGRIEPRRTPYPTANTGHSPRLQQILNQTAEPANPQLVSTARAADAAIQRGQSPDAAASHWSQFANFPTAQNNQGAFR